MDLNLYQDLEGNNDRFRSGDSLCSESKSSSLNSKLEHESAESQSSQSKGSHSPSKSVCSSSSTSSENIPLQELKVLFHKLSKLDENIFETLMYSPHLFLFV